MAKDYAKFVPAKSRQPTRWRRLISLLVAFFCAVFLILAGVYCLLIMKKQTTLATHTLHFDTLLAKAVSFADLKKASQQVVKKAASSLHAANEPPPVHFDFYNELPNQRMKLAQSASVVPSATMKPAKTLMAKVSPTVSAVIPVVTRQKIAVTSSPVIHADEVSALIAAEDKLQLAQYALHLGTFENKAAALRFSQALAGIGFTVNVVKTGRSGGNFEVQNGPYTNPSLAKADQVKLQKRGITSDIRKL